MSIKKGVLYGVGVGPGSPDLMTLKAVNCIRCAEVICLPQVSKDTCRAYQITEQAVPEISEKECLFLDFKMTRDESELRAVHEQAFQRMRAFLEKGKKVAFLTIGDPCLYSTFSYVAEKAEKNGHQVELVSGISSVFAAAASLGISLCEGEEELHIGTGMSDMGTFLSLPGTKVILKCGRNIRKVKEVLRKKEQEGRVRVYAVTDCKMPEEKVFDSAEKIPEDYMTVIIVK